MLNVSSEQQTCSVSNNRKWRKAENERRWQNKKPFLVSDGSLWSNQHVSSKVCVILRRLHWKPLSFLIMMRFNKSHWPLTPWSKLHWVHLCCCFTSFPPSCYLWVKRQFELTASVSVSENLRHRCSASMSAANEADDPTLERLRGKDGSKWRRKLDEINAPCAVNFQTSSWSPRLRL